MILYGSLLRSTKPVINSTAEVIGRA